MNIQTEPLLRKATATNFMSGRSLLLQRQCACGGSAGTGGKCEACRQKRMTLQRRARNDEREPGVIPPIVHDVLHAPGQALDVKTRDFMASRFAHDFGDMSVHSRAEQSAWAAPRSPARLFDKETREIEVGHTDCDWDRAVEGELFKPKSGKVKVNIGGDACTQPCTIEHEAAHVVQVEPICKTYFDCYTGAAAKAKEEKDCKDLPAGAERKKCEELYAEYYRLECFVAVGAVWDAEKWECEAYKKSLACAVKEQPKADKECKGKLKEYEESAKKQSDKYCKPQKKTDEKPKGSPDKPSEPEAPKKDVDKKPAAPKKIK